MRTIFFDFIDAVEQFRDAAREQLQESLARDTHEASAALFLAFLQLFQIAQKHVNRFTARLTEFYHGECLRIVPRKAEPRSVYLVCRRAPNPDQQVTVPRGATFALGRDDAGHEVHYRADETLHVTPVAVAALQCSVEPPFQRARRDVGIPFDPVPDAERDDGGVHVRIAPPEVAGILRQHVQPAVGEENDELLASGITAAVEDEGDLVAVGPDIEGR